MRRLFSDLLQLEMRKNEDIYLLVGDLGFRVFNNIKEEFPHRFYNCGAAEQSMMDIAIGLALSGKIPFVYSITPFLLYRPYEALRTYINYENIPVKMIGSGRDKSYAHDGISHWCEDAKDLLNVLPNIKQLFPDTKDEIEPMLKLMLSDKSPYFMSLIRER